MEWCLSFVSIVTGNHTSYSKKSVQNTSGPRVFGIVGVMRSEIVWVCQSICLVCSTLDVRTTDFLLYCVDLFDFAALLAFYSQPVCPKLPQYTWIC